MTTAAHRVIRDPWRDVLRRGLYRALAGYLPVARVEEWAAQRRTRRRIYPPLVTLWAMLHQALRPGTSDAAASLQVASWLGLKVNARSGALAKARARLALPLLEALPREVAQATGRRRRRRPVFDVDGTGISVADTAANREAFGKPPQHRPGCGFPVLKLVVLMDAASGAVVDYAYGWGRTHEVLLAAPMWDRLPRGAVVVCDRGFASYAFLCAMAQRGVEVVVRQHGSRRNQRPGQRADWTETWARPDAMAPWWDADMPPTMAVRVIWHRLPSGKMLKLNVSPGLRQWSAAELAQLYRERWRIETMFAELKVDLGLEPVAANGPEMVAKRLAVGLLALNLALRLRWDVAHERGWECWRVSFCILRDALLVTLTTPAGRSAMLRWLAAQAVLNPCRDDRHEPRERKRRPKPFPWLSVPREEARARCGHGRA
jgi:hypothetical protein